MNTDLVIQYIWEQLWTISTCGQYLPVDKVFRVMPSWDHKYAIMKQACTYKFVEAEDAVMKKDVFTFLTKRHHTDTVD